jgi:hypothetical protein
LKTGNYCDYRNPAAEIRGPSVPNVTVTAGLVWQQWLGTALQAMGVSRSEYEEGGKGGYPGIDYVGTFYSGKPPDYFFPSSVFGVAGEVLPFLKA